MKRFVVIVLASLISITFVQAENIVQAPHFEGSMGPSIKEPWFKDSHELTLILVAGYGDLGKQAAGFISPTGYELEKGELVPAELYQDLERTNVKKFDQDSSMAFLYRIEDLRGFTILNFANIIYELENSEGDRKKLIFMNKGLDPYSFGYPENDDSTKVIEFEATEGELIEIRENFYQVCLEQFGSEINDYDVIKVRLQNVGGRRPPGPPGGGMCIGGEILFTEIVLDAIETGAGEEPIPHQPTFEVITAVGSQVLLSSQSEERSQLGIFDASGRLVDEVVLEEHSIISWGKKFNTGVYFIKHLEGRGKVHKVVLVR